MTCPIPRAREIPVEQHINEALSEDIYALHFGGQSLRRAASEADLPQARPTAREQRYQPVASKSKLVLEDDSSESSDMDIGSEVRCSSLQSRCGISRRADRDVQSKSRLSQVNRLSQIIGV